MEASWNSPGAPQPPPQRAFSVTSSPSVQGSSPVLPSFAVSAMYTETLSTCVRISVCIKNDISICSTILKLHLRDTFLNAFFIHMLTTELSHNYPVFIHSQNILYVIALEITQVPDNLYL